MYRWNRRCDQAQAKSPLRLPASTTRSTPFVVVADAGVEVAESLLHRAGQRREVDEVRGSLLTCVPEDVSEDSRPSASVLTISMVVPFIARTMSPGR